MNAESLAFESVCESFKNEFNKFFDWNDVDVTYFCVNIKTKKMHIASNNYEWQLIGLENNLDKLIEDRLKSNIQYWSNYSELFKKILFKSKKNKCKVDFCNRYDNTFEITTINTNRELYLHDLLAIYQIRPEIAEFSHQKWKQNPEVALPMRATLSPDAKLIGQEKGIAADLLSTQKYLRFGNIRLTQKEMFTIRLLLSQRSIKEISHIQGCSTVCEHKRIQNIKEKLGCPYASLSGLFAALKEQGITLACLDVLMELPEVKS